MPLLDRLQELRRQVRRLLWLAGAGWVVVSLMAVLLLVGGLDWLLGANDRWLRMSYFMTATLCVASAAWRWLIAPLRKPLSNVELSGELERQFPQLRGQLATAVEFVERGVSPRVGSVELQNRLIEKTSRAAELIDFENVLDRRPATRAVSAATAVMAIAAILALTHPAEASIALSRLLWPFGTQAWPKRVELQLVTEDLMPLVVENKTLRRLNGQPLDLFVVNARGPLPESVQVEFRQAGSPVQTELLRKTSLRDTKNVSQDAAAVRIPVEEGLVEFHVIGGDDDDMPWRTLEIIPPVKVESFHVRVTPPAYTREPSVLAPENGTQVRALLGTRLEILARLSRPIRRAEWAGSETSTKERPTQLTATVDDTGREVRILQTIGHSGSAVFRLSVVDRDGFANPSALRLDIVGVVDSAPTMTLLEPASDRLVTPQAILQVQGHATDDRALHEVALELLRKLARDDDRMPTESVSQDKHDAPASVRNQHDAPASVFIQDHSLARRACWKNTNSGERDVVVRDELKLSELPITAGDRLQLQLVASDFCDVGEPRVARSARRTLTVVTPAAKRTEIANRLGLLLHDLELLVPRQIQARNQIEELRVQAEKTNELRPQDRDLLKRVDLDQRQIEVRLTGPSDGLAARAQALLDDLAMNQLSDDSSHGRLTEIVQALGTLGRQTLPTLKNTLAHLVKVSATSTPTVAEFGDVAARQAEVVATLQSLVRDLAQWNTRRELAREIAELADSQTILNRETAELAPSTLGKTITQLPSQQQADLAKLADRQSRQAERIEQLRQRLANSANGTSPENSTPDENDSTAQTAREVVEKLDEKTLVNKAREASQEIAANNLGQADQTQKKLTDDLKELVKQLQESPHASSSDNVRELRQLETQLSELRQQQQQLTDATRKADDNKSLTPDELAEQAKSLNEKQKQTRDTADELASQLKSQQAGQSLEPLRRASRHMRQAERELADQKLTNGSAEQQAALDDLEQSQRELANARREAEQDQLAEQASEFAEAVKTLVAQQQVVITETERLATEHQKVGKWTRPLAKAAISLGGAEQSLVEKTQELAESLSEVEAVHLTLNRAAGQLSEAATRLSDKQLDAETLSREQAALRTLQTLAEALSTQPTPNKQPPEPNSESSGNPPGDRDGNGGKPTGRDNPQASDSSDRDDAGANREAMLRRERQLREAVWGHLPPVLREKMLNLPHDKMLPKYSEHIRRYYEALAEEL